MRLLLILVSLIPNLALGSIETMPIPKQAFQYFETIKKESKVIFGDFGYPYYFAGLIEHESCITLTHKKCWNPSSQLLTKREQGIGLFQLTRAWKEDGTLRFDTLSELRKNHMDQLKELSWSNVVQRPDLQIRAGLLLIKTNYNRLYPVTDGFERLAMSDAAYNGGLGGLLKERTTCGLAKDCDPQYWFDHVERYCLKSMKPLYGNRSSCDINRYHVQDVLFRKMAKYKTYF